jgi:hypothetical protein
MRIDFRDGVRSKAIKTIGALVSLAPIHKVALGADIPADGLKIAAAVVKAPGYETPPAKVYVVANSTNVFSDHAGLRTEVTGSSSLEKRSRP